MMPQGVEIQIRQTEGRQKGLHVTLPMDDVLVLHNGMRRRVGFVDRSPGATVRFCSWLTDNKATEQDEMNAREAVRKEVERLRDEQGLPPISLMTAGPPKNRLTLKKHIHRMKHGTGKKTFILGANGQPL